MVESSVTNYADDINMRVKKDKICSAKKLETEFVILFEWFRDSANLKPLNASVALI